MLNLKSYLTRNRLYLDPRTKILLVLCCGMLFSSGFGKTTCIVLFFVMFIIGAFVHNFKSAFKILVFYVLFGLLPLYLLQNTDNVTAMILTAITTIVLIFTPAIYAFDIATKTTTVSDTLSAFRKMHLPDALIIPLAVFFRFIPTIKEEWQSIRRAMKLRGIGISFWNVLKSPMMNLEYVLIPLMMSTASIAEELAAASISRGLAKGVKRTPVIEVKLHALDYCLIIGVPIMLVILFLLKQRGVIV